MAENYDLKAATVATVDAPVLPYQPPTPRAYAPQIGLIGCGGITQYHLQAYKAAGWNVTALYNPSPERAEKRRAEFYPEAKICDSVAELLALPQIEVVDIATHAEVRGPLIEQALRAGKHVLSQKPFVVDLTEGARLVALARSLGRKLAVNQNGRWAPYFSYQRQAVSAGLIGEVSSVHIALNWDHTWTAGTAFEEVHHLILSDFAIHWFDAACSFFGNIAAKSVYASVAPAPGQTMRPPLVAASVVNFARGLATLAFDASSRFGGQESCIIVGTKGTLRAVGPLCAIPAVELITDQGAARAELTGAWFPDGFGGTMGELLCAIEENRKPENSADDNLRSLAVCRGAIRSADEGRVVML